MPKGRQERQLIPLALVVVALQINADCKTLDQRYIDQVEAKLRSQKVADRIVSYYQDHSRVLPNKKDRGRVMTPVKIDSVNRRSAIEAKISEGERMCVWGKSLYQGFEGDKIWSVLSVMVLNIRKI